jgi:hypothetical protein
MTPAALEAPARGVRRWLEIGETGLLGTNSR